MLGEQSHDDVLTATRSLSNSIQFLRYSFLQTTHTFSFSVKVGVKGPKHGWFYEFIRPRGLQRIHCVPERAQTDF